MTPTVLVTGANGFLGRHVAQQLSRSTGRVLLGGRFTPVVTEPAQGEYVEIDLLSDVRVPPGVETVVHVAGEKRNTALMQAVNHRGTERLLEAAIRAGVRRFVMVSSVGSYGAPWRTGVVDESFPPRPANEYEISKHQAEAAVRTLCERFDMEYIILQPSNVVGIVPGKSYPLLGLMKSIKAGRFRWFGSDEVLVNYVAVEDVASCIAVAASMDVQGTFIVNEATALKSMVGWIAEELGVSDKFPAYPLWIGQAFAKAGAVLNKRLSVPFPVTPERLSELTNTTRYDDSAFRSLGWSYPLGLESAVRKMVRTYSSEGKL
jgi:nucleoside-diphosphate-sugar epimerase